MKEYCVDLDIAMELKINDFSQKTYFCWMNFTQLENDFGFVHHYISDGKEYHFQANYIDSDLPAKGHVYYAPTSDELLKELPHEVNGFHLRIEPVLNEEYIVGYWEEGYEDERRFDYYNDKKLTNALAKMWLYLKKEGLLNEVQRK